MATCADALPFGSPGNASFSHAWNLVPSNVTAPPDFNRSQCSNFWGTGPSMWFRLTDVRPAAPTLTTCDPSSFDTDMAIFSGTCGALTQLACSGDASKNPQCQAFYSALVLEVEDVLAAHYIVLGGYNGATGSGLLHADYAPPPPPLPPLPPISPPSPPSSPPDAPPRPPPAAPPPPGSVATNITFRLQLNPTHFTQVWECVGAT